MSARRAAGAALVALGLTATAAVTTAVAQDSSPAARLTRPVIATDGKDEVPTHSYTSPSVAVDPEDPLRVYAATVEIRTQRCALLRSTDGGRTWVKAKESPSPASYPFCTHTTGFLPMGQLAVGREGTLYYSHIAWDNQDGGWREAPNRSVFVARSTDFGETWKSTAVRDVRGRQGNDIETNIPVDLVVDTTSGEEDIVYVSWNSRFPLPVAPAPTRPSLPMMAVSTDGGATFSPPINVAGTFFDKPENFTGDIPDDKKIKDNFGGTGANLAVDEKGTVSVSWTRSTANISPTPPSPLYLSRTTDRGKTFTVTEIMGASPDIRGFTAPVIEWSPDGGPNGSLHAVWEGKEPRIQGDTDIIYRRSTDDGKTWSPSKVLNDDDPDELFSQYHPYLRVAPNGRLDLAWWDMRDNGGRYVVDVYYSASTDAGATWSKNVRVTDRSIDRSFGIWRPGTGGDVRQPPGIASTDELVHIVWDDTRNGNPTTETQDLFAANVQYERLAGGGANSTVKYVLAGLIGVGSVGLLLILASAVLRGRRRPESDRPATRPGREQVEVT